MENAVQALLIAAGVLIGMIILSLGISLYTSLSGVVESTEQEINSKEVQKFNEQFVKYINCNDLTEEAKFVLTIQDVVTAANSAFENNRKYELTEQTENNYYVTVKLNGTALEGNINSISAQLLQNNLEKQYKCSTEDVKINLITGRVYEVNFHEITS